MQKNHNEKKEEEKKQDASQVYMEVFSTGWLVWQSLLSIRYELRHLALYAGQFCFEFLVLFFSLGGSGNFPFPVDLGEHGGTTVNGPHAHSGETDASLWAWPLL